MDKKAIDAALVTLRNGMFESEQQVQQLEDQLAVLAAAIKDAKVQYYDLMTADYLATNGTAVIAQQILLAEGQKRELEAKLHHLHLELRKISDTVAMVEAASAAL